MTNSVARLFTERLSPLGCSFSSGRHPEAAEEAKNQGGREAVGYQWVYTGDVTIQQDSIINQLELLKMWIDS